MSDKRYVRLQTTDSTNRAAMELAHQGASSGTVVTAEFQTAGRGRLQRQWHSPAGTGLYFSYLLRPALAPADIPLVALAAGVAACHGIADACGVEPGLKWPNDLLIDGRKLGGILSESEQVCGETVVIVGFGINVLTTASAFPPDLAARATSLKISTGESFSRDRILETIVSRMDQQAQLLDDGHKVAMLDQWRRLDCLRGRRLSWMTAQGLTVYGEALGLDDKGAYRIRDEAGRVVEVVSGDVRMG